MSSIASIRSGPFLMSIGCLTPHNEGGLLVQAGIECFPEGIIDLDTHGVPHTNRSTVSSTFGNSYLSMRRSSGIPRAQCAARSAVFGAVLGRFMLNRLASPNAQIGVALASTTGTAAVSYEFERRGLTEGWDLVDPLLLPSTIPSAAATQLSIALGTRGFAVSFLDTFFGFFHALEFAVLEMQRSTVDAALVLGEEEITPIQELAHRRLGCEIASCEGAAGLLLNSHCSCYPVWRVSLIARGLSGDPATILPPPWRSAWEQRINCPDDLSTFYSLPPAFVIAKLLTEAEGFALLCALAPTGEWRAIGFEKLDR